MFPDLAGSTFNAANGRSKRTPGRRGKRGVAFWLNPAAFEEERSVQSLMEEATDLLFQSRGKHRIARAEEASKSD
ncbi:MAG: hypothetical protein JOY71_00125 [Acetobacteraceae bacterium]|nr:hypothetical protein [Acetobacteraceae bacterium]MBV8520539.1 hypothetical protein [Acetobacteraceae bacterium]